jgi:uncharacterized membrane protein YhhN
MPKFLTAHENTDNLENNVLFFNLPLRHNCRRIMVNTLIIFAAVILLPGLLYYENKKNQRGLLITKTILSLLFVIAALIQPHHISVYYYCLLIGLTFCLGGDIFLALRQKMMFLFGLISFLTGHILYIFGFFYVAQLNLWMWMGVLTVSVISIWVYFWLKPHLGSMKTPVVLYVIVITIMLSGAWSVLGDYNLARSGRIIVFIGACSFYFSDIFVARDRFLRSEFLNRLIGLPMYYTGQFLLAFSIGLLR